MPPPSFKNLRLPAGAAPTKWPVLVGLAMVSAIVLSLLMSGDPVIPENDPLAVDRPDAPEEDVTTPGAAGIDRLGREARMMRARREQAEADAAQAAERSRREAAAQQRQNASALARAQERLAALRSRGFATPDQAAPSADPAQLVARTADEASMLESLRVEDIARQVNALRSPPVVSSARGYGLRAHNVQLVPPVLGALMDPAPRRSGPARPRPVSPLSVDSSRTPNQRPVTVGPGVSALPAPVSAVRPPAVSRIGGSGRFQGGPSGSDLDPFGGDAFSASSADRLPPGEEETYGTVVTPSDGDSDRLYEGLLIPAVLQTQINADIPGPISAQVTRHVYSRDRQRIVIPRGTTALGESTGVEDIWQGRLAVSFHRLIFPDGSWLRLEFTGLNSIGESSLRDQVDRHYIQLFGVAGAVGALAGFTRGGGGANSFGSAASEQMAASAVQIVSRFLNRLPTITIRAGHRLNIRLMSDVLVPRYLSSTVE